MIDDILSNIPDLHPLTPKKGARWRWWHLAILIAILVAISVGIYFLLNSTHRFLRMQVRGFAIYAYIIVFFVSALSAATIFIPAPGIVVAILAARIWNPWWVVLAATTGGAIGELTAYYAGYWGSKVVVTKESRTYIRFEKWARRYGLWAVMVFAALPFMPFHIGGIAAGALRLPMWQYLVAMFVGKGVKTVIEIFGVNNIQRLGVLLWVGILRLVARLGGG